MRRMLVTGAAGFIGSNFVHFWTEGHAGDTIVGLDALTYAGNLSSLESLADNEKFTFVKGDIRDGDAVREILKSEGIDTIIHFAAETHVDRSIRGPDPFIDTNVLGTHELLKAARDVWSEDWSGGARRFHHISTDEVYGSLSPTAAAFTEDNSFALTITRTGCPSRRRIAPTTTARIIFRRSSSPSRSSTRWMESRCRCMA